MAHGTNSDLVVCPVSGRKQLKEFIRFPRALYATDPNWIAPLMFEQLQRFTDKNPFFEHARWQAWLVRRGGTIVGRISAQIDDLHNETQGGKTGYFGLIEAQDDAEIFSLLFSTAEQWLRERGMTTIQGPFNLSINEECGLLVDGYDTPPFIMMGHAHQYYAQAIETEGYTKAKDLLAYIANPNITIHPVMKRLLRGIGDKVVVRKLRRKQLSEELDILRDLFNDSWSNNWGFTPFTKAEFDDIGELITLVVHDEYIQIAEIDGRPVAMIVVAPDINDAARDLNGRLFPVGWLKFLWRLKVKEPDRVRSMLMGVRKEFHHTRLGPALAFLVINTVREELVRHNVDKCEMSWILEDNDGMKSISEGMGGVAYKRYRVYEKTL